MMCRSERIQEDVNSHFSGNSEHRQQAELIFFSVIVELLF